VDGILGLTILLILALGFDAIFGDPRWLPHPVRGIGLCAIPFEKITRAIISNQKLAGIISVFLNIAVWCTLAGLSTTGALKISPWFGLLVSGIWIYFTIAINDLASHVRRVAEALESGGVEDGRKAVSMIVGRDTEVLEEDGIVRAGLESAGENLIDGVISALFWAVIGWWIGGPTGAATLAIALRVINTLDATYGYKNERYLHFGWCAARLDDCVHFIPARLTTLAMMLTALCMHTSPMRVWRITLIDHGHHSSPNSGWGEAALAGLLDVTLGGPTRYAGKWADYPTIGNGARLLQTPLLREATRVIRIASIVFTLLMLAGSAIILYAPDVFCVILSLVNSEQAGS